MPGIRFLVILALVALPLGTARAQFPFQPWADWRTIETAHFQVHAPRELEPWARHAAARLEAVRVEVLGAVGHVPAGKVQVVVHDPYGQANGSAWPMLDFPMMVLWPIAPSPRSAIGNYGDWSALLTIHEFTHLAHLTVPSRNPAVRLLWSLAPRPVGPVAQKSPRWVIEGYATYVEGRLTGLGRPYGAYRAAILRQWAIEGALPTYPQLSASGAYLGGSLAYLGGSAYLEWLARRGGDSSLVHLWRRMSARVDRGFPQAFAGVYGRTPEALYGRFTAELTRDALAVEGAIDSLGGRRAGELVQRLAWGTGDPALSPDGTLVALSLASGTGPRRLVVIPAAAAPDTMRATRRAKLLARDPLDVPDSQFFPAPRTPRATLRARQGLAFDEPRWMPGGTQLLVSRSTPRADGTQRQDLYLWEWKTGRVRRVTHGAGVQQADPSPDGRRAVATRCTDGSCDAVMVELASGAVRTLLAGDAARVYQHPRFAPDGARVVVAMLRDGRWRVALSDTAGRAPRVVDADDGAHRYDPVFADSGRALLVTSERGGIANLERIPLDGGSPSTLTRVTGAAVAPVQNPADGSVWFLSLHARGLDLRRLAADTGASLALPALPASLAPAVPTRAPFPAATLAETWVGASRSYGVGPRQWSWLPLGNTGASGSAGALAITTTDPIGRLGATLTGAVGSPGAWRGARLAAVYRGFRPELRAEGFAAEREARVLTRLSGGLVSARVSDARSPSWSVTALGSVGRVRTGRTYPANNVGEDTTIRVWDPATSRAMGSLVAVLDHRWSRGEWATLATLRTQGDVGRTAEDFQRLTGSLTLGGKAPVLPRVIAEVRGGTMHGAPFEAFSIGGTRPLVVHEALLPQQFFHPAIPTFLLSARSAVQYRVGAQLGILEPYYAGVALQPTERYAVWRRVYGVEARLSVPAFSLVALPAVQLQVGVGRSVEEKKTRFYLGSAVQP
ncbi:MAG TPA: hypothetical protein VGD77_16115 [Gemmatimonadaceae bacterium]